MPFSVGKQIGEYEFLLFILAEIIEVSVILKAANKRGRIIHG